jgi:hypothetical protein
MKLMHTRLPDFYKKVIDASRKNRPNTEVEISGLENYKSGKLPSLRVGRVENEIAEITKDPAVKKVEVILLPRNPETYYTVIIKGVQEDGTCNKAILETMHVSAPAEDYYLFDVKELDDRR